MARARAVTTGSTPDWVMAPGGSVRTPVWRLATDEDMAGLLVYRHRSRRPPVCLRSRAGGLRSRRLSTRSRCETPHCDAAADRGRPRALSVPRPAGAVGGVRTRRAELDPSCA